MDLTVRQLEEIVRRYFFADDLTELDVRRLHRQLTDFAADRARMLGLQRQLRESNGLKAYGGALWWEERRRTGATELDVDDGTRAKLWLSSVAPETGRRMRPNCPADLHGTWACVATRGNPGDDYAPEDGSRRWTLAPGGVAELTGFPKLAGWSWRLVEARTPRIVFVHPTRHRKTSSWKMIARPGDDEMHVVDDWGTTYLRLDRTDRPLTEPPDVRIEPRPIERAPRLEPVRIEAEGPGTPAPEPAPPSGSPADEPDPPRPAPPPWRGRPRERIVMEGRRVTERLDAIVSPDARFVDCELVKTRFDSAEFRRALFDRCRGRASFTSTDLAGARFLHCDLAGSDMRRARIVDATIEGGDWTTVWLERAKLSGSTVRDVTFRGTHFYDCVLDGTVFERCDFREAFLELRPRSPKALGSTFRTRFVDCDLRGARIGGRRLLATAFERCKLHGVEGTPVILGPYAVVDPDLSPDGDGSDVRDARAVHELWGSPG